MQFEEFSEEWPACPKCRKKELLIGGRYCACINCGFLGNISEVASTRLLRFVRAKISGRVAGHRGVVAMIPGCNELIGERLEILQECASRLAHTVAFDSYLAIAETTLPQSGEILPTAILNESAEMSSAEIHALEEGEDRRLSLRALCRDTAAVLRRDKEGRTVVDVHCYNSPGQSFIRGNSDFPAPAQNLLGRPSPPFLIWQPLDWSIVEIVARRKQPRYLAILEVSSDINLTFCAVEDMDGAPLVRVSIREPWSVDQSDVRDYPVDSIEEGVELLRGKFQSSLAAALQAGEVIVQFQAEWPEGVDSFKLLRDIRKALFWADYAEVRQKF